ncbi:hypothetical protein QE152_g33326 [Popillia japonica]|uniref:Uncharacterized protein n=1 Tax=Popillia japonica TaxID=7064 RepID=A0AAW1IXH2_POPJA
MYTKGRPKPFIFFVSNPTYLHKILPKTRLCGAQKYATFRFAKAAIIIRMVTPVLYNTTMFSNFNILRDDKGNIGILQNISDTYFKLNTPWIKSHVHYSINEWTKMYTQNILQE